MDAKQVEQLLINTEGPKYEFKRQWYSGVSKLDDKAWGEFLKDIISLANGNVGCVGQTGYLIIGAADEDPSAGTVRQTFNVPAVGQLSQLQKLRDVTLRKLHSTSSPGLPDIKFELVAVEPSKRLLVIEIPSPAGLLKLDRDLSTRGMRFRKGTVLIRVGQDVCVADPTEIAALQNEFKSSYEPTQTKVLHNLPNPDYIRFVGRKKELERLAKVLHPKDRIWTIVIDGIGGIGKSALALETARRYLDEFTHLPQEERFEAIIWVSAKATTLTADGIVSRHQITNTIEDIYKEIARTLQEDEISRNRVSDQNSLINRALTRKRTLLIIDNLETIDDERVNAFIRELPTPTKCIVTTRHRINIADPIRLSAMPREDALSLIAQECTKKGVKLTDEEADLLYRRTGGLPLAVVWSVSQMGYGYGVKSVLHRLGDVKEDVSRFCFEEAVNRIKDKPAYVLLVCLSIFDYTKDRKTLGQIANLSELDRDEGLVELERLSLINKEGHNFNTNSLVKEYVLDNIPYLSEKQLADIILNICSTYPPASVAALYSIASFLPEKSFRKLKEKVISMVLEQMYDWAHHLDDYGALLCINALGVLRAKSAIRDLWGVATGSLFGVFVPGIHEEAIFSLAMIGEVENLIKFMMDGMPYSNAKESDVIHAIAKFGDASAIVAIDNFLSYSQSKEINAALRQARENILLRTREGK